MARARIHQHVNPLAKYFQEIPVAPLDVKGVYEDPELPLHIDLGSGRGRFLLKMAVERPDWNYLGIEIREPLVIEANDKKRRGKIPNLHYTFCNAPLDLGTLLSDISSDHLLLVTIQFPDPWFKKRHAKRRMVNERLVELIHDSLAKDGYVFVQTDVEELSLNMSELFIKGGFTAEKVDENILPVKTEREISVENRGLDVYRGIYRK